MDDNSREPSENQSDLFDSMRHRARQLERQGFGESRAWAKAWLEHRISQWPRGWENDLVILLYGDFEPPETEFHIKPLDITVYPEKLQNTVIGSAGCVLEARVKIKEKTIPALIDAARRINVLLGAWTLVTWGNSASGWWSWVTHGTGGGVLHPLSHDDMKIGIESILQLPGPVRKRVDAALYWIREPRNPFREFYKRDLLRTYVAYWNAFECLVEAVNIMRPQRKVSKSKKQQLIDDFVSQRSGGLTPADIQKCYQDIVNPGFVGKASHALRVCFGTDAETYISECFTLRHENDRLHSIRNAINHGEVDAENLEELIRIDSRLSKLWMIVWGMFGRIVSFSAPVDPTLNMPI